MKLIRKLNLQRINKSLTSDEDLFQLANSLNFWVDYIGFGYKFDWDSDADLCIFNIGNDMIGGTHWVAVSTKNRIYFDPLGAPPPPYIPVDYSNNDGKTIQNMKWGRCGQYCVLALYYISRYGNLHEFNKQFKVGYDE